MLTGCFGDDDAAVFVGQGASSVLLVQWVDEGGGQLNGTVQVAEKSLAVGGEPVKQTSLTFTGTLEDGLVSLEISEEQGQTRSWDGTLDGDKLEVGVPQGATGVESVTLIKDTVATFSNDVTRLENGVVKARAEADRAAARAQAEADRKAEIEAVAKSFADARSGLSRAKQGVDDALKGPGGLPTCPRG